MHPWQRNIMSWTDGLRQEERAQRRAGMGKVDEVCSVDVFTKLSAKLMGFIDLTKYYVNKYRSHRFSFGFT